LKAFQLLTVLEKEPTTDDYSAEWLYSLLRRSGFNIHSEAYGKGVRRVDSAVCWVEWAKACGRWSKKPREGRAVVVQTDPFTLLGVYAGERETLLQIARPGVVIGIHPASVVGYIDLTKLRA